VKTGKPRAMKTRADLKEIDRVRHFLRHGLRELAVSDEDGLKIELSLHEIFVNIALYAYPERGGDMDLKIWRKDGMFFMEFRDRGVPFDPAGRPAPDLEEHIRRGKRGGLGVYLFKSMMDGYTYRRDGDENILTVYKKI
jgi:serine/threonine-protein kinase RsbW